MPTLSFCAWTMTSPSVPATTWAFVTTTFGATIQPEPSIPRPQALPRMRTVLFCARRTPGLPRIAVSGRPIVVVDGPSIAGSGSKRASACSTGPDGGRISLSCRSTAERCTSVRSEPRPGVCSATAPAIQTAARATAAPRSAPAAASRPANVRERTVRRARRPRTSNSPATIAPRKIAPPRANTGAHGEDEPPWASCVASREPANAPAAKPASVSAPTRNPRNRPCAAAKSASTTMIQSMVVTLRRG